MSSEQDSSHGGEKLYERCSSVDCLYGTGPLEVGRLDGMVCLGFGGDVHVYLDRRMANDLLHAIAEAMERAR